MGKNKRRKLLRINSWKELARIQPGLFGLKSKPKLRKKKCFNHVKKKQKFYGEPSNPDPLLHSTIDVFQRRIQSTSFFASERICVSEKVQEELIDIHRTETCKPLGLRESFWATLEPDISWGLYERQLASAAPPPIAFWQGTPSLRIWTSLSGHPGPWEVWQ